ncbi:Uncharacterized protein APZ42_018012 [Daphnia magna]|uniref:Uncharacterized protein n=1 Tax=Daphnia magna TaxID=35525 RepID=A0A162CIX9_9CRUS|nr:Uncharacterized protein APZ42_018012 [Daphnia magna]
MECMIANDEFSQIPSADSFQRFHWGRKENVNNYEECRCIGSRASDTPYLSLKGEHLNILVTN